MIKVFGDSHARIFKKIKIENYEINCKSISGTSISGLPKKKSSLDVCNLIIEYLKNNNPDYLILNFGQVDIDLGFYYKTIVKNKKYNKRKYIKELIIFYDCFIKKIMNYIDKSKIIICDINPPSLKTIESCYKYTKKIVLSKKIDETISNNEKLLNKLENIKIRTEFSECFNKYCKEYCDNNKIKFFNTFDKFLGEDKIILDKFTDNDDHHIKGIKSESDYYEDTNIIYIETLKDII